MNFTVFYSWQSDLENKYNRSFIEDVLEKAVKIVSKTESFSLEAVIDRDTYGIPGSPSIVEAITTKIAKSDVFVCDVSVINAGSKKRLTPNPNVLYELGYASAILGWDRIIMIQNTAYGGVDKLPFDLRGRRILSYNVDSTTKDRSDERKQLKESLIRTFTDALLYYASTIPYTKEKIAWWGNWRVDNKTKVRGGWLNITRVSSDAFLFHISLFDGARSGEIAGKAQIVTPHSAYARITNEANESCEIIFKRRLEGAVWCIEIEEGLNCSYYRGFNATFSGIYFHNAESILNLGYLDEIDMNEICRLTGKYLPTFLNNFQQIQIQREGYGEGVTVVTGGVKGLYTIMESIAVVDTQGNVWCACLDPDMSLLRYFTNSASDDKPPPIDEWLKKFPDKTVVINESGDSEMDNREA